MMNILILAMMIVTVYSKVLPNNFMLIGVTTKYSNISSQTNCLMLMTVIGGNSNYLCSKIPQLPMIIQQSNIEAQTQCQKLFRTSKWGCYLSRNATALSRFLRQGSKESAFFTAISSSILSLNLIKQCLKGQINDQNCQCGISRNNNLAQPVSFRPINSDCPSSVNYGIKLSQLITNGFNMPERSQHKLLYKINQWNREIGKNVREFLKLIL
ncbi:unnamed protein product, partial [Didymodactylos carnosus]